MAAFAQFCGLSAHTLSQEEMLSKGWEQVPHLPPQVP